MSADSLLSQYKARGIERHGALLLPREVALDLLAKVQNSHVVLLGFDAFQIIDANWIQPVLEFTLDLSDSSHQQLSLTDNMHEAERVVKSAPADVHFEFVFGD